MAKKVGRPKKENQIGSEKKPDIPKMENLDDVKTNIDEELNKLQDEYKEEKSVEEKKDSKYYKSKKAKEAEEQQIKDAISGVGSSALSLLLERMPNPKPLTAKESEQFDVVFDRLSQKYFSYLGKFQEETAFIIVLGLIILPRTKLLDKKEIPVENKNEDKNEEAPN